jgi:hypothetical protein
MVVQQHRDGTNEVATPLGGEVHVTQSVQFGAMREMLDRLGLITIHQTREGGTPVEVPPSGGRYGARSPARRS